MQQNKEGFDHTATESTNDDLAIAPRQTSSSPQVFKIYNKMFEISDLICNGADGADSAANDSNDFNYVRKFC